MEKKITLNHIAEISAENNNEIKIRLADGLDATVRKTLPLETKVKLIEEIVVSCSYGTEPYFNPLKLKSNSFMAFSVFILFFFSFFLSSFICCSIFIFNFIP